MSERGYRGLFVTYPLWWRLRYEDEMLDTLREADAQDGRTAASLADRVALLLDGLTHRLPQSAHPVFLPLLAPGHRFDQTNGLISERVRTTFEIEHERWWDQLDVPAFVPVAMTGGRAQVRT